MEETIDFYKKVSSKFSDRNKAQSSKFMMSYNLAYPESLDILEKYNISLTKNSQIKVITIDPDTLTQALELATKMNFIDAYREDPNRLCQMVTNVIRRMAYCDAKNITYRDEEGKVADFIFNGILFTKTVRPNNIVDFPSLNEMVQKESTNNHVVEDPLNTDEMIDFVNMDFSNTDNFKIDKAKELAMRIMEQFAMQDKKPLIYSRIDEMQNSNLETKEILMEAFKICAGNLNILSDTIDELLLQEENNEMRKAA